MPKLPKEKKKSWVVYREQKNKGSRRFDQGNKDLDIYNTKQWKATRAYHIQKNPICKHCFDNKKRIVSGDVVDHIIPIRQGGSPFDFQNLQTLCNPCHNVKSIKEKQTITYTKDTMYR